MWEGYKRGARFLNRIADDGWQKRQELEAQPQTKIEEANGDAVSLDGSEQTVLGNLIHEDTKPSPEETGNNANSPPAPTSHNIDRWQHHTDLQIFGQELDAAAKSAFPDETKPRYSDIMGKDGINNENDVLSEDSEDNEIEPY